MKFIKKLLEDHTRYTINEENGCILATCNDPERVVEEFADFIALQYGVDLKLPKIVYGKGAKTMSGGAICDTADSWNEEKGKRIAFNKLYNRQFKPYLFNIFDVWKNRMGTIFDMFEYIKFNPQKILDEQLRAFEKDYYTQEDDIEREEEQ